jgi:hypothetical protein
MELLLFILECMSDGLQVDGTWEEEGASAMDCYG